MRMHDTNEIAPRRLRHGYHRSCSHRWKVETPKPDRLLPHLPGMNDGLREVGSDVGPLLVSIVTPTSHQRSRFALNALRNYQRQRHPRVELLVMDDGGAPSEFWLEAARQDPNVRYFHVASPLTLGFKRNELVREAKGEIIAQMDDDDFYGEAYVDRMVEQLLHHDADVIKLGR
jgi:hypothetical protein